MGVAAFYRWLTKKYPKVQTYVVEEKPQTVNGVEVPVDATRANPNGVEFDNLYLDMNGIVHPCCHPQFREAPKTEEAMMVEVFKCLDRVFNMIRPRKLVYMALDGVAPRAKMNQQRSRRFRAAQEAEEKEAAQAQLAEEIFEATGERQPAPEKPWDSNCITPGTPFMELLAKSLRYYVVTKLNEDPAWREVKVVLSDSNVPGEGEHKIMDYIRRQRMMPAHDPNTRHVLYGLDADLIMLSLATHEPHFKILREDVAWADMLSKPCRRCGSKGHFERNCRGRGHKTPDVDPNDQPFVFANIDVLREYLDYELRPQNTKLPFPFDLERAIDDWVFLCFFVGNDFLPHLPSLEIREGALEKLVNFWKEQLPKNGGFITHDGDVDLFRVQPIMDRIAAIEEETFRTRKIEEDKRERQRRTREGAGAHHAALERKAEEEAAIAAANARREREREQTAAVVAQSKQKNTAAADAIRARLAASRGAPPPPPVNVAVDNEDEDEVMVEGNTDMIVSPSGGDSAKRPHEDDDAGDDNKLVKLNDGESTPAVPDVTDSNGDASESAVDASEDVSTVDDSETAAATTTADEKVPDERFRDTIKFHEAGYKERYYLQKFQFPSTDRDAVQEIAEHYVRGLCWVLKYYYQGCASWSWYYPYHYAPLASDLVDLDMMDTTLELSAPLRPYEQLMGVLPARSRHNLPAPFGPLMTEKESPIIDFYPRDFPLDLDGKKFLWQAVILLPFIDSKRLLTEVQKVYPQLTADETARNQPGAELLMVSAAHPLYASLLALYESPMADDAEQPLNPKLSGRMSGSIFRDPGYHNDTVGYPSPLHAVGKMDIAEDLSISAVFHQPNPMDATHTAVLLQGLKMPPRVLTKDDLEFVRTGGNSGHRGPPRSHRYENNRDFRDFYRQQGNDVSQDRGRGPRRYDEHGNVNQQYIDHYDGRHRQQQQRYQRSYGRNDGSYNQNGGGGGYGRHHGGGGGGNGNSSYEPHPTQLLRGAPQVRASGAPPAQRPVGYQPFGGRSSRPSGSSSHHHRDHRSSAPGGSGAPSNQHHRRDYNQRPSGSSNRR
ncbi:5'-3' exoribonuclease 2 [Coemansia sp. RSA 2603]|nr:5'-3' exoribonuclease 2 [Coemansia sp. RSA 2603]